MTVEAYSIIQSGYLLQRAIDMHEFDVHMKIDEFSLLQHAAIVGDADIIRILLENGIDPDEVSPDGDTALHVCAQMGKMRYVDLLLRAKANPNIKDAQGRLPDEVTKRVEIEKLIQEARAKGG